MNKKVALITLHGMGETDDNYYQELKDKVFDKLGTTSAQVSFQPVNYQCLLQPNEDRLWNAMKMQNLRWRDLRKFVLFGFADAAGLETRKEILESVYEDAQLDIACKLWQTRREMGGDGPLVAVAQSLGAQVFSSYVFDAQRKLAGEQRYAGIWKDIDSFYAKITALDEPEGEVAGEAKTSFTNQEKEFLSGKTLVRLLTTGCNIPIFVAAHKELHIRAIDRPNDQFEWLNLYDRDDVLGWPLRPLSGGYERLVEDRQVNAGQGIDWLTSWTPLSHRHYWKDRDVVVPLAEMILEAAALKITHTQSEAEKMPARPAHVMPIEHL